jgi:hypothetical protein
MMLNTRTPLFDPTKYVQDLVLDIEEDSILDGSSYSGYELDTPSPVSCSVSSGLTEKGSTFGPDYLPHIKEEGFTIPTTGLAALSFAETEGNNASVGETDSEDMIFASNPSTSKHRVRPLMSIYEGLSDSYLNGLPDPNVEV